MATLKQSGLCKTAHYKELYLPQAEIEGELSLSNALPPSVENRQPDPDCCGRSVQR